MPARKTITGRSGGPRARFAQELKKERERAKVTLRRLSREVGWNETMLNRMENGIMLGGPDVVEDLDTYYKTGDKLLILWELAVTDKNRFKRQYRPYMELEEKAVALWHYGATTPPGLLQTEGFARAALIAGGYEGEELERQIQARLERQRALFDPENPVPFRSIMSEAVLRNPLADLVEWRKQLEFLLEVLDLPGVSIQVLPFGVGRHGLVNTNMMFLQMVDGTIVAYAENDAQGELIEDSSRVEAFNRAYDALRDLAYSPAETRRFIMRLLEELPCDPST
ncbi:helix-turn-helix domain-containing protein [Streptomyces roseirectus]|uniref:Helix-turn-helix domain-containing protein n=1 Tax=Streptomyces roseirectus TaxID=2768066 RepID=A0A7H0IEY3_9ACTN|nr:helix-turn-helix transcriptional regulator [Streptomyces roseirectus]QNP71349.1 helix-turn-helix domain-containing protein [Streptomyces roseirectus]